MIGLIVESSELQVHDAHERFRSDLCCCHTLHPSYHDTSIMIVVEQVGVSGARQTQHPSDSTHYHMISTGTSGTTGREHSTRA